MQIGGARSGRGRGRVKFEWPPYAKADRDDIFDYIADDNPRAAVRIDRLIEEAIGRLLEFPEMGRPGRVEGLASLSITRTPYVAVYRRSEQSIHSLRLLHGAQRWP
jgi:toxin ParE1/3/4